MKKNGINQKSLTRNIFGQLTKLIYFIINQEADNNIFEFEKNDQLISRSESEHRIVVILAFISLINATFLTTFSIIINESSKNEIDLIDVEIPVLFKVPYLQAIYKNGSVVSSHFLTNSSDIGSKHLLDLPETDYYYSFLDHKQESSFIHAKSKRKYFFQTFKNIHGKGRQRKHKFTGKSSMLYPNGIMSFNSSIMQIGSFLMFFGGGQDGNTSKIIVSRLSITIFQDP